MAFRTSCFLHIAFYLRFLASFMPAPVFMAEDLGLNPIASQLFKDLEMVHEIDRAINDSLPLLINYQLQGGYFTMPSARTYDAGVLGFGFSYLPPYRIYNLGFQFFDHIETTGNYWIFHGVTEGNFGHLGFGDDAERAANIKFILLRESDGFPFLPDLAVGWNDFLGSCRFNSFYAVATKQFLPYNFEATIGWGRGRIKGAFGGLAWAPLRHSKYFWKGLTLAAEYDANNYRRHPSEHNKGRSLKTRINGGAQLDLWDLIHLSVSSIRGENWAASAALRYNLGSTKGCFPKIFDPAPYKAPIDTQPLGLLRSQNALAQELAYAFKEQGFDLYTLYLVPEAKGFDRLWMKIVNVRYREEAEVRTRIENVLSNLSPSNIATVTVVIEADGVVEQEYRFRLEELRRYREGKLGEDEFRVVAPMREASSKPSEYEGTLLFKRRKPIWLLTFRPWLRSFFGSSSGKYKYEIGFGIGPEGYLFDEIYYCLWGTYTALSSTQSMKDRDVLNPSRIINVRTDSIRYNQANSFHLEQAFIQKSWNIGHGWFSRIALGYFEMAYAGVSTEALFYPVNNDWAFGFEVSSLLKREYFGIGFQHKVRKLTSNGYEYFPYFGFQYFAEFYYQYKPLNVDFKISAGQFLARDKGIRIEGGRTFESGLRVGLWYTLTNAGDVVNNHRYYDKGFSITMPLDIFLNKSSRSRIGYAMSAWLRDCGARAATGKQLYPTLFWERFNGKPGAF
ncbi:MAG: YjbH domain-containing protein [Verrucomicrobia bacterium]|nr:YjbH domain-containing protein [Verrucomicrobiota bacterium]